MLRLVLRRFALLVPILLGVSLATFMITRLLPGDPARLYAGIRATEETVQAIRIQFGFDKPIPEQYIDYVGSAIQGDLGTSVRTRRSVTDDLLVRAPATLELIVASTVLSVVIAIPLGVLSAVRRGKTDAFGRFLSAIAGAIPDFWLGLIFIVVFYAVLDVAPAPVGRVGLLAIPPAGPTGFFTVDALIAGDVPTFLDASAHLLLPALALAIPASAPLLRLTRNATIEALNSDYVLFARASGLRGYRLHAKFVLRNALPSAVAMTALNFGYMLGGAVLVEKVFSWPGVGLYAANSIEFNDYSAIQGFVLLSALVVVLIFLADDLLQYALDPRVRQ
jgi:peptide/nickel transport system permease protein